MHKELLSVFILPLQGNVMEKIDGLWIHLDMPILMVFITEWLIHAFKTFSLQQNNELHVFLNRDKNNSG